MSRQSKYKLVNMTESITDCSTVWLIAIWFANTAVQINGLSYYM